MVMANKMNTKDDIGRLASSEHEAGFVTDIDTETLPPGLNEDVIRFISNKKEEPDWLLDWRLSAYKHWLGLDEPVWAHVKIPSIDFQSISYFSAPKGDKPKSLEEVDAELLKTYDKLGIPLHEQAMLAGVEGAEIKSRTPIAVDAVFDSVSIATTF